MSSCWGSVCWWLVGLVLHGACLAVVTLSLWQWQQVPVALVTSIVYLLFLMALTRYWHGCELVKEQQPGTTTTSAEGSAVIGQVEDDDDEDPSLQQDGNNISPDTNIPATTTTARDSNNNKNRHLHKVPFYLSLLYLATNLAAALPGAIVVFCILPCGPDRGGQQRTQHYYKTNITALPSTEVVQWMNNPQLQNVESFAQLADGTLYLVGSYEGSDETLYAVHNNNDGTVVPPQSLKYTSVFDLTRVSDTTVCFVQAQGDYYQMYNARNTAISIGCGNATAGFNLAQVNQKRHNAAVFSLRGIQDLLWFRLVTEEFFVHSAVGGYCSFYDILQYNQNYASPACRSDTFAVFSMNTTSMQVTGYSVEYEKQLVGPEQQEQDGLQAVDDTFFIDENGPGSVPSTSTTVVEKETSVFCQTGAWSRPRAAGGFFLSALPTVVGSGRAWVKSAIPSAPISLFFGIGLACTFVMGLFQPWAAQGGLATWLMFGTPLWTVVSCYQLVVNPRVSKAPLWWNLYVILTVILGLVLFQEYMEIFRPSYMDDAVLWIMDTVLVHLPTLVIASLTRSTYIYILALIGFATLEATIIWKLSEPPNAYGYTAAAYVLLALVSCCIYRSRESLHNRLVRWLSACARHTCAVEAVDTDDDYNSDELNTAGLLVNEDAEEA